MDFSKICRMCLSNKHLSPIFLTKDHKRYANAVYVTTGLKVAPNDGLPQNVCLACVKYINESLKYRKKCNSVHYKLLNILNGTELRPCSDSDDRSSGTDSADEVEDLKQTTLKVPQPIVPGEGLLSQHVINKKREIEIKVKKETEALPELNMEYTDYEALEDFLLDESAEERKPLNLMDIDFETNIDAHCLIMERNEVENNEARINEVVYNAASNNEAGSSAASNTAARISAADNNAARISAASNNAARISAASNNAAIISAANNNAARISAASNNAARISAASNTAAIISAANSNAARISAASNNAARISAASNNAARISAASNNAAIISAANNNAVRISAASNNAVRISAASNNAAIISAASNNAARISAASNNAARSSAASNNEARNNEVANTEAQTNVTEVVQEKTIDEGSLLVESNKPYDLLEERGPNKKRRTKCKFCRGVYSNLLEHIARIHPTENNRMIKCNYCFTYVTKERMARHERVVHFNKKVIKCQYCNEEFDSKKGLVEHPPSCQAKNKSQKVEEMQNNSAARKRQLTECNLCQKKLQRGYIKTHYALKHAGDLPVCEAEAGPSRTIHSPLSAGEKRMVLKTYQHVRETSHPAELWTVGDFIKRTCEILGLTKSTVKNYIHENKLERFRPPAKPGPKSKRSQKKKPSQPRKTVGK